MARPIPPEVSAVFDHYPKALRLKLLALRKLILTTAAQMHDVGEVEETLKWGEPSYLVKGGSTIRINARTDQKNEYAMYFHCKTRLVDTFRVLYADTFQYEGNRAIIFNVDDAIPIEALQHCISLSLTYHQRKNLPLLGA